MVKGCVNLTIPEQGRKRRLGVNFMDSCKRPEMTKKCLSKHAQYHSNKRGE